MLTSSSLIKWPFDIQQQNQAEFQFPECVIKIIIMEVFKLRLDYNN